MPTLPYIFANQSGSIPLAELDANFAVGGAYQPAGTGAVATTVQNEFQEIGVILDDYWQAGDGVGNYLPASQRACTYCYTTGATLRLQPKVYPGARIEVHGTFCVEGNGATVQYLGVGQTIILGTGTGTSAVPTPWPIDAGYTPSIPATTMYTLSVAPSAGATSITLVSATGISAGQYLFLAGNPSSVSTPGNFIPKDFEFVRVISVASNVVTLAAPLLSSYLTTQSGLFYAPGLAIGCTVSDLAVNTTTDAYQYVVRGSIGCTLEKIRLIGTNNPGASTFSENLTLRDIFIDGTNGGGISTARGTVSTFIENVQHKTYTSTQGFFIEESFYNVRIENYISTGNFSAGSMDCSISQRNRKLIIENSVFDPSVYGGVLSPFSVGTFAGADIVCINTVFRGSSVTPSAGTYPGITGQAVMWVSGNSATDSISFINCKIISTNGGTVWPSAIGGFLGTVQYDSLCSFTSCSNNKGQIGITFGKTPASGTTNQQLTDYEEGTWTPAISFYTPGDLVLSSVTAYGTYTRVGRLVTIFYNLTSIPTYTTASGYLKMTGLPFLPSATYDRSNAVGEWTGFTITGFSVMAARATAGVGYLIFPLSGSGSSGILSTTANAASGTAKYLYGQISFEV